MSLGDALREIDRQVSQIKMVMNINTLGSLGKTHKTIEM